MPVSMPIYAGIDPGLSGAIAFVSSDGLVAARCFCLVEGPGGLTRELDTAWLSEVLEEFNPRLVFLEQVQGFGGVSSAFKLGQTYGGIICSVLTGRFRLERVRPQTWQKAIFGPSHALDRKSTKASSIAHCRSKWPEFNLGRRPNHNITDALCLAEYARRTYDYPASA